MKLFIHSMSLMLASLLSLCCVLGNATVVGQVPSDSKKSHRARRPEFKKEEWHDIFFEDLFSEGLSGERPVKKSAAEEAQPKAAPVDDALAWSRFIPRDVIENEVKSLQQDLQELGTTVSRFNTQFREMQQKFSLLSMLFAIIHEFDTDVRWKSYAQTAQQMFADAAAKSRTPSKAAFEMSRLRKQDLQQLVRGGRIDNNKQVAEMEWPRVIDRTAIMVRLEQALGQLKQEMANEDQFRKSRDLLLRESCMIAAMGKVITQEGMDEAEEDGYVVYADSMRTAASDLSTAIETENFTLASAAVNRVEQSCINCHGEWR